MELHLVAAIGPRSEIGVAGGLPWRLPEDLRRFKAITMGHAIVMGRKTFESIGRPLPGRRNLVVTRGEAGFPEGIEVARTIEEALAMARQSDPAPMVIGGGEIYRATLPWATHLHITHVDDEVAGADAFFPAIEPREFEVVAEEPATTPGLRFVEYRRRPALT